MNQKQQSFFPDSNNPKKTSSNVLPTLTIFIDGASRGNPGLSGAGIYGIDHHGHEVITQGFFLGVKTNNQAEYLALAIASMLIHDLIDQDNPQSILFVADSQLLVRQMQGIYKVKNPVIRNIKQLVDRKLLGITCSFRHVLREYNVNADKLANVGVDKKKRLPEEIARELQQEPLSLRVE